MLHLNPAFRILLQDFLKCVTLIVIVKFTVKKIHISFHDSLRIAGRITKQVSSIQPSPRTNVHLSVYFSMLSFHSSSSKVVTMWPISLNLIFTSNKKLPSLAHTHTSCQANIHYLVLQHVQSSNAELWRLTKQQRIVFTQLERVRLFYFISWTFARRR